MVVSLVFVGYELKRTNDIAVVQTQHELLALLMDAKSWLMDPAVFELLNRKDLDHLSPEEKLLFDALIGSWFDIYEAAYIAQDQGILTDSQFIVWKKGMCNLPGHWRQAFSSSINNENYIDALVAGVKECEEGGSPPNI